MKITFLCIFETKGNDMGYEREPDSSNTPKIYCCCYAENIHPWIQNDLRTPSWRFYWDPVPGGYLRVEGEEIPLLPEYFYIIPGYFRFSTLAKSPFSQFYIHFDLSERQVPQHKLFRIPADERLKELIRRFIGRSKNQENDQLTRLTAVSIVSSALLSLPENILRLPPEYDPRIRQVLSWMLHHLNGVYSNDFLAEKAGMSRNGFLRLFKSELKEAPQKFFRRKRIERACEMLQFSDLSIEEIAEATGFSDRYHFTRVFWQVMHFPPAGYRKQNRSLRD